MAVEIVKFSYLSEFINLPVLNCVSNKRIGRIVDVAASTLQVYPRVTGLVVKPFSRGPLQYIPWISVKRIVFKEHVDVDPPSDGSRALAAAENEILLRKSFMDKQVISTSGYKVVRVNDVQFLIEDRSKDSTSLWAVHIDIGVKGILRRLGYLKITNAAFRWLTDRDIKDKFVSWKNVQPAATSPVSSSVQLKTDASKLSEIHPADLADILEDLGIDERIALLESLDRYVAAVTLQEMPLKNRLQIAEALEPDNMAAIVNEMQIDEAVDLLDEIDPEKRQAVFEALPREKVAEIKDLSRLSTSGVGRLLNTDFITARREEPAGRVLDRIREECEKAEMYRYAFVLDDNDRLIGIVTLRHLLISSPSMLIADLMSEQPVAVHLDTHIRRVAKIFFKYRFEALPVVDDDGRMQGVVSYHDVLAAVFPEVREESVS